MDEKEFEGMPVPDDSMFEGMTEDEIIEQLTMKEAVAGSIDELYESVKLMGFTDKIRLMNEIRIKLEAAKGIKVLLQARYDALRLNIIPSAMEDDDISNITVDGVGRVTLAADMYCSIPKDKRSAAWKWLRENKLGDIISETINSGTLKATIKSIMKKGQTVPADLFKVTPFSRASITKK